jgi:hypothetical protein
MHHTRYGADRIYVPGCMLVCTETPAPPWTTQQLHHPAAAVTLHCCRLLLAPQKQVSTKDQPQGTDAV